MKTFAKILCLTLVAVMLCATLASCAPASDPDKAKAALDDAGYATLKDSIGIPAVLRGLGADGADTVVTATHKDGKHVTVVYFKDSKSAKDAMEKVQKYAEDNSDDEKESDWVFKRSGAMIYWGTKDGVKDAR